MLCPSATAAQTILFSLSIKLGDLNASQNRKPNFEKWCYVKKNKIHAPCSRKIDIDSKQNDKTSLLHFCPKIRQMSKINQASLKHHHWKKENSWHHITVILAKKISLFIPISDRPKHLLSRRSFAQESGRIFGK